MSLKALAEAVLERHRQGNRRATGKFKEGNFYPQKKPKKLPSVANISKADLRRIAGPDWDEIKGDPKSQECLSNLITIRLLRERGEIPAHYTSITECQHCGMVPIWEGVPAKVFSCVWCFNRVDGKPMPLLNDSRSVRGGPK